MSAALLMSARYALARLGVPAASHTSTEEGRRYVYSWAWHGTVYSNQRPLPDWHRYFHLGNSSPRRSHWTGDERRRALLRLSA
jgi:hypothetical protein